MKNVTFNEINNWNQKEKIGRLIHISELVHDLMDLIRSDVSKIRGIESGWPVFDQIYGGIRPGEVISLTGETGKGKTTFAIAWMIRLALKKVPVLFFSLEVTMRDVVIQLSQMILQKTIYDMKDPDAGLFLELVESVPIYIVEQDERMMRDDILAKTIAYGKEHFNIGFVLIDHLDYIQKTKVESWKTSDVVIGDCMRMLCRASIDNMLTTLLIVHPKKLQTKGVESREIGMDELKGSSSIKQESAGVISLFRFDDDPFRVRVRFQKIRAFGYSAHTNACVHFRFDPLQSRFLEQSAAMEYPND